MDRRHLQHARDLLLNLTPLNQDCGVLCGQACCASDPEEQSGMILFPGERELYEQSEWASLSAYAVPGGTLDHLRCDGRCPRAERPLACRIFPLTPYFDGRGELNLRLDQRAWAMCPLMEYGLQAISRLFFQGVLEALQTINADPEGHEFLIRWQQLEELYRIGPL